MQKYQETGTGQRGKCPPPEGVSRKISEEDGPALFGPEGRAQDRRGRQKAPRSQAAKAGQGCFWYFLVQSDSSGRGAKSERFFRAY